MSSCNLINRESYFIKIWSHPKYQFISDPVGIFSHTRQKTNNGIRCNKMEMIYGNSHITEKYIVFRNNIYLFIKIYKFDNRIRIIVKISNSKYSFQLPLHFEDENPLHNLFNLYELCP